MYNSSIAIGSARQGSLAMLHYLIWGVWQNIQTSESKRRWIDCVKRLRPESLNLSNFAMGEFLLKNAAAKGKWLNLSTTWFFTPESEIRQNYSKSLQNTIEYHIGSREYTQRDQESTHKETKRVHTKWPRECIQRYQESTHNEAMRYDTDRKPWYI